MYYHTTFAPKEKIDYSDVMSELVAGQLIYDIFPADRDLQIYSYTPKSLTGDGEDIKITLKSVNLKFSFLVYLDLDKIEKEKVPADSPMKFKGFTWQGGYNNELVIKKTDPNYTKTGTYYILIQKEFKKSDVTTESIASFYLDVTTPSTPLQLVEGLEHSTRLDDDFAEQTYWYAHFNLDKSIELNVNIFVGMVNIYVNTTSFKSSDLQVPEAKSHLLKYAEFIRESTTFKIPPEALKKVCKSGEECEIFIMVQRASAVYDTDYLIVGKSSEQRVELLTPGIVKTGTLAKGQTKYFYIEEMTKRKATSIMVHFDSGVGEMYVRIPEKPEALNAMNLPNETNYNYKGEYTYMGNLVQIPSSVYNSITKTNPKIQIQIAIVATGDASEEEGEEQTKFKISYSSDPRKISQNLPWNGFITAGEFQYFELHFEKNTKNIYISLSNMNGGDADLYMNYGLEPLPTTGQADWFSVNPGHEFLSIKSNDKVYKTKKIENMGGDYSLLVIGYTDTSYTLFISSGDNVIFPMMENTPITCKCHNPNDKCYFNYENFDSIYRNSFEGEKKTANILFLTNYLYGRGNLYAKFVKSSKFYEMTDVINAFPTESDHYQTKEDFANPNLLRVSYDKNDTSISANS